MTAPDVPTVSELQPGPARTASADRGWRSSEVAGLLDAVLGLAADLDLRSVMQRFVDTSVALTGATYGAINVLDSTGTSRAFVQVGVDQLAERMLGSPPHARGVLGRIPDEGTLRLGDLTEHPAFEGFPPGHPKMGPFLGAAVRVRHKVFGHLYLSNKPGGFTAGDEEVVVALAAATGVALENAQLYADAERREHWVRAGQDITTMLLSGVDEEDALARIAATAREVADADVAALALPGIDGSLVLEIIDGLQADELLGAEMPDDGRAAVVLSGEEGMLVEELGMSEHPASPTLGAFGPALFAPMRTSGHPVGVLILLRRIGKDQFDRSDLDTAVSFARQAALAFVLAEARQAQDAAALLDERERIARDLHDLAIQQLFATGMQLETVRRRAERGVAPGDLTQILDAALDNVDGSVREIRSIVHALRDPDAATSLVERLRREASLARTGLGFAPSLVVELDGAPVPDGTSIAADQLDNRVAPALTDDVVAVVREGLANAARHAHAASVAVRVEVTGAAPFGEVVVEVVDDGQGLPDVRERRSGTANLEARARQHHGTCELGPSSTGGARLVWRAPLVEES